MGACLSNKKSPHGSPNNAHHGAAGATGPSQTTAQPSSAATNAIPTGYKGEIKMLLLGAGESGKSTIWKQMKIIHLQGFSDEELVTHYKPAVIENVVQLFQGLTDCVKNRGESLSEHNIEFGNALLATEVITAAEFDNKYPQLLDLWRDPKIQETANDPDAKLPLVLQDSAHYWYKHIDRILREDYKPTVKDIIKSRTKTTGISDIAFEIDGYKFKLTDVGGQRSERKKWISCFQNLTAILFVVALSEYDQTLNEDAGTNRMSESIKLFRGVVGNDALHHVAMILFLNKEDLFNEKIKRSDLRKCFPDYPGEIGDKDQAFEYIKNQFVSLNSNPNRKIYTQVTVATDIEYIRRSMDIVKDIVIAHALNGGKAM
jgi:GTPase SAR1 family protein